MLGFVELIACLLHTLFMLKVKNKKSRWKKIHTLLFAMINLLFIHCFCILQYILSLEMLSVRPNTTFEVNQLNDKELQSLCPRCISETELRQTRDILNQFEQNRIVEYIGEENEFDGLVDMVVVLTCYTMGINNVLVLTPARSHTMHVSDIFVGTVGKKPNNFRDISQSLIVKRGVFDSVEANAVVPKHFNIVAHTQKDLQCFHPSTALYVVTMYPNRGTMEQIETKSDIGLAHIRPDFFGMVIVYNAQKYTAAHVQKISNHFRTCKILCVHSL